jgi:hypothetical protein
MRKTKEIGGIAVFLEVIPASFSNDQTSLLDG